MSDRDTLSSIGRVMRSDTVRWLLSLVAPAAMVVWSWAGNVAKQADLDALQAQLKAANEATETASRQCDQGDALLRERLKVLHQLSIDQLRWIVRIKAADAEPRRAHRMETANAAEAEFLRQLNASADPITAARIALSTKP